MSRYQYKQHPHVATRKHPAEKARSIGVNERIGLWVTKRVGTMWAAYAFFGLSLVSLPAAIASGNEIVIVSWVAQTFLQLVLLPIIIVGQVQANNAFNTLNEAKVPLIALETVIPLFRNALRTFGILSGTFFMILGFAMLYMFWVLFK